MSHKLQLSPVFKTRESPWRIPVQVRWGTPPGNLEDARFFRSWLVYDSDLEMTRTRGRINWNLIAGLTLMAVISAAGWGGVAWLVAHFWK